MFSIYYYYVLLYYIISSIMWSGGVYKSSLSVIFWPWSGGSWYTVHVAGGAAPCLSLQLAGGRTEPALERAPPKLPSPAKVHVHDACQIAKYYMRINLPGHQKRQEGTRFVMTRVQTCNRTGQRRRRLPYVNHMWSETRAQRSTVRTTETDDIAVEIAGDVDSVTKI